MLSGGLRTRGIRKESQENMSLITVVTVVRNGEKTLEQTILSVIDQTYTNIEYIVVDGASTDGTLDIIRKYEDRIDYWQSEPDEGIYDAMNKGIDLAMGDFIVLLNSDDWFELDACQKVVEAMDKKRYMIYYAIARVLDENGNILYLHGSTINNITKQSIAHQTCFIAKEIYKEEKYSTDYKSASDYEFFLRIASKKIELKFIEKILVNYRLGGMSDSIFGQIETIKIKYKYRYITYIEYIIRKIYLAIMLLFRTT
jgi:glycosyltransferase involved in cell wall biosynthesis